MMNVLQVGLGNFGKRHLEAWHRLGCGDRLWIAEQNEDAWPQALSAGLPRERLVRSMDEVLAHVGIVDIVTPTDSHFTLCQAALQAGKDVFVEKPMTMTSEEAKHLVSLAEQTGRLIQVGYYYRFHPISQRLKAAIRTGELGTIRYVTGNFCGFKRARNDVGVTHTDGIHFLDLINWLLGSMPLEVYAVCRDHFRRGLEDFSLVVLTYPGGIVGKVESGYIQPGRWKDKVVAGAMTTKDLVVVGDRATAEVDFETEMLTLSQVRHELRDGTWTPVMGGVSQPPVTACDPVQLVARELEAFVQAVDTRAPTQAGPVESGLHLATLIERIYESAKCGQSLPVEGEGLSVARAA